MSLADEPAVPENNALFVTFNQDFTSLAVGDKEGYRIFSLAKVDEIDNIYEAAEEAYIFERLFNSSLIAIVNSSSPRKLRVCHFKKGTEICSYSYSNTVLSVRLNRRRLVVCLEESIFIHNIRDMQIAHLIRDTPPNPKGVFALSVSDPCYLAYPGSSTIGEVQIFDAENLQAKLMIPAHNSPLVALAFDAKGAKLATASEKGTVIRVFQVTDGTKLFEFRRGVKRCVSICSLNFSLDSVFLCVSSNTETVHIFKVKVSQDEAPPAGAAQEDDSWVGYFTKAVTVSASYLPTQVTGVFTQGRAFATLHLPFQGLKNICAIALIEKVYRLLVASEDGYLYIYNFDSTEGQNNVLYKQHRLFRRTETSDASGSTPASGSASGTTPPISIPGAQKTEIDHTAPSVILDHNLQNPPLERKTIGEVPGDCGSDGEPTEARRGLPSGRRHGVPTGVDGTDGGGSPAAANGRLTGWEEAEASCGVDEATAASIVYSSSSSNSSHSSHSNSQPVPTPRQKKRQSQHQEQQQQQQQQQQQPQPPAQQQSQQTKKLLGTTFKVYSGIFTKIKRKGRSQP